MSTSYVKLTDRPGPKSEIAQAVFGVELRQDNLGACQPYFEYYVSELELLHTGIAQETRQTATLAVRTYEDIFHVVRVLRQNTDLTRPQIRKILLRTFSSADTLQLNRTINLAIRLWLMINFQDTEFETLRPSATCVEWNEQSPLKDSVQSLFPKPIWELNMATSRLGPFFTASFMHKVCGLKLEWTTSLYDHLRLDRRKNSLKIFPFKCHIAELLNCHESDTTPPIPRQVLHETLLSLELLFPIWDVDTVALLKKENQTFHMTGPFYPRAMSLLDFHHWRDRLLELQEILQSPPVSWAQLWKDRRNPQQFWTFWIALLILILTVISSVTSIVQAWASLKALNSGG